MNQILKILILISFSVLISCSNSSNKPVESPTVGATSIYIDETFLPIIKEQEAVFEAIYPLANLNLTALPEAMVVKALIDDTTRAAIITRELSQNEVKYFNTKKIFPQQLKIASDAVAIIINNKNTDSIFSIQTLEDVFTGKASSWNQINKQSKLGNINVVFDNQHSSTIRLIQDSICRDKKISSKLSAVNTNKEVIEFVKNNKNSIGIIGVNWISNSKDSTALSFLKDVTVAYVSRHSIATLENSYQPFQAYIALSFYPLTRNIYFINCGPYAGLAKGFMSFIASQRGQKIIQKAGILPATMPLRLVQVTN